MTQEIIPHPEEGRQVRKNLADLRAEAGYSQKEFAALIHTNQTDLRAIEQGRKMPREEFKRRVRNALNIVDDCIRYGTISDDPRRVHVYETKSKDCMPPLRPAMPKVPLGVDRFRRQAGIEIGDELRVKIAGAGDKEKDRWTTMEVIEIYKYFFVARQVKCGWKECFLWQDFLSGHDHVRRLQS